MGQEIEYKLRAESREQLESVYEGLKCRAEASDERIISMHTRYLDTPERFLGSRKWMLRIRRENKHQVMTCKTPGKNHARGEWNLERRLDTPLPQPQELEALTALGAPAEIAALSGLGVSCEAVFTRRCTMLRLPDGTKVELAADVGRLCGRTESVDFCELELELYGGSEETLAEFASLAALPEEPLSKAARALRLR